MVPFPNVLTKALYLIISALVCYVVYLLVAWLIALLNVPAGATLLTMLTVILVISWALYALRLFGILV